MKPYGVKGMCLPSPQSSPAVRNWESNYKWPEMIAGEASQVWVQFIRFHSSIGIVVHWYHRGHVFNSYWSPDFFLGYLSLQLLKLLQTAMITVTSITIFTVHIIMWPYWWKGTFRWKNDNALNTFLSIRFNNFKMCVMILKCVFVFHLDAPFHHEGPICMSLSCV